MRAPPNVEYHVEVHFNHSGRKKGNWFYKLLAVALEDGKYVQYTLQVSGADFVSSTEAKQYGENALASHLRVLEKRQQKFDQQVAEITAAVNGGK